MRYTKILATGSYLPPKILTNSDIEKLVDTTDEWIFDRTGIKQRHIAEKGETPATMSIHAAKQALKASDVRAEDIDMVIVATSTPAYSFPSTACFVQAALGIPDCPAFDISIACAGFNYALSIADQYIKNGAADHILIIGAEIMSRIVDWTDRRTCILFADGAGAVLLGASTQAGIISTHLHADGKYQDLLYAKNAYTAEASSETVYVQMKGNEVFRLAINMLGDTVSEALTENNLQKSDINWLIPHQANMRIIKALAKKLDLPMERVVVTVDKHGNTSSASIPLALDEAVRDGRIKRGDTLLLESFGGGFAWGSAVIKY